ncbi:MAG: radical SAM protein [Pseudorhodoplanes sp.]|uniref:radical SAM protein n=1 Tax=Pseudorhodoplanes sp. TaxID=1934341 RepID=UPI003D12F842
MIAEADRLGFTPERLVCTGDIVAYAADASKTVALVRDTVSHIVKGNCEESLGLDSTDCGCGFPEGSECSRLSDAWFRHAGSQLSAADREWMAGLPERLILDFDGIRLAVVHGSVGRINQFVFASTGHALKLNEIEGAGVHGVIGGHCGLPFTQSIDGYLWHNAGAIGMPANDGTPRVWYSIISRVADGLAVEHRSLSYDHVAAANKMRRAGLPDGYAAALSSGLWLSCDVLPLAEIRARGHALEGGGIVWKRPADQPPRTRRVKSPKVVTLWPKQKTASAPMLDARKFRHPETTAAGEKRASVDFSRLSTLWFNTGTLCNISCRNCYIDSGPRKDQLAYLSPGEVSAFLDEIDQQKIGRLEIGFTGGEPFMNPGFFAMLDDTLSRGHDALVLTNAMRPMQRAKAKLLDIKTRHGDRLRLRVSLDHFTRERHEEERGHDTFMPTMQGLIWLARSGFNVAVAGRTMWGDPLESQRAGYAQFFAEHGLDIDANSLERLVLFPEMEPRSDVPEITEKCWDILGSSPQDLMCSQSRMVVKRKGADRPVVLACTLIAYDSQFELGQTLKESARRVWLNHPSCAKFCVLGKSSCSPAGAAASAPMQLDNKTSRFAEAEG